ncbi:MAG: hypothetical protein L6U16_02690 [Porphyromonadaceae bacterium]|nr:MAG: hypothetical protein L6U16_02690 [Porphyromonadaceae bacterium]
MRLRNTILDAAGYDKDQVDSFYICDEEWNKEREVTVMDMGMDSDDDIWLMDDTPLEELLEDEGQRLKFVFDMGVGKIFLHATEGNHSRTLASRPTVHSQRG